MADETNTHGAKSHYDDHYGSGGWKYKFWTEFFWHRRHIVKRFRLRRGMRMLEVGCGSGFHTNLFNRMGFDCIGIDRSTSGIEWATTHYPRWTFYCRDYRNMPFEPASFDVIVARGLSPYHYDLADREAIGATATLMRHLKPRGVFVMSVISNLSGDKAANGVWHNTIDDYKKHFSSFNKRSSVDWANGTTVCGLYNEPAETVIEVKGGLRPALA